MTRRARVASRPSPPRVLYLPLEYSTWDSGRHWSYSAGLGLEEGLRAHGVDVTTIPTPWLHRAREIAGERPFDQVWVEAVHQAQHEDAWWEWVAERAPVRVGFLPESLEYTAEECQQEPRYATRKAVVEGRFPYLTHVAAVDEYDAATIAASGRLPSAWWPQAVPERFVVREVGLPPNGFAWFAGKPYGDRALYARHESISGLLANLPPPEDGTVLPALHEALHLSVHQFKAKGLKDWQRSWATYLDLLRHVRQATFARWIEGLRAGCAVVNLPHMVKGYASRVPEGMAAGRPVISWRIPNRPRTEALFENGKEILLFEAGAPEMLGVQIQRVLLDPRLGQRIAEAARKKLLARHTMERRVAQLLRWIETGEAPAYV